MTDQGPTVTWEAPPEPKGPAPGVQFAPHGERLIAYIIDGFIVGVVVTFLAIIAIVALGRGVSGTPENPSVSTAAAAGFSLVLLIIVVLSTAYFPWFWARGGQTPGMKPFRLRVVRDADGGPIGTGAAIVRLIGMWVAGAALYIGYVWVFVDSRRRGWHDLIAGTVVVKQP